MRRSLLRATWLALLALTPMVATAQPRKPRAPSAEAPPTSTGPTNLRAHVGADHAARLLRSVDPDERIRGIQRAAALGTPEAVTLLVQATESSSGVRTDPRALLELARGLSRFAEQDRPRDALLAIVNIGNPGQSSRLAPRSGETADEGDPVARVELARQTAAIAVARAGSEKGLEKLYAAARAGGSGQAAALGAFVMHPPREPGFFGTNGATLTPPVVRLLGRLGDLRALELLHGAAKAADVNVRAAALLSLADLGDERAALLARAAIAEGDARLRAAAAEAFVVLAAPERYKAVAALISDEATTAIGVRLAERVHSLEITKLLAARVASHPDIELRFAVIRALGRSSDPEAAKVLAAPPVLGDPTLAYPAALALARSPAPNAMALLAASATGPRRTLVVRAYVVRALARSERHPALDDVASAMAQGKGAERALGTFVRVALGADRVTSYLEDGDVRVRRAALMGALAFPFAASADARLARLPKETDPVTRQLLFTGLVDRDPAGVITSTALLDRAESAGADGPIAALAFARRADEASATRVGQLLGSPDPVLRAHVARGLASATLPDATGRLAAAYAYESDPDVRRATVLALALRTADQTSPSRRSTLEIAANLDPDGQVRQAARRALLGEAVPFAAPVVTEAAWLRVSGEGGSAPGQAYVGSLVRSDGLAVPLVFDEEGFAVVPGVPPGDARLVLVPRLPTYKGNAP